MRRILTMLFVSVFMLSLCPLHAQETETLVLIDTDMGKIKVKLFNDTPLHRDNFYQERKRTPLRWIIVPSGYQAIHDTRRRYQLERRSFGCASGRRRFRLYHPRRVRVSEIFP